ncbi:MAG: DUF2029 domain-containing protein [Planctomycetales bacterium]|nr:DUF2029 domain-containing protein [Planctomycetales bacterium]
MSPLATTNESSDASRGRFAWWSWSVAAWVILAIAIGGKAIIAPRTHTTFPTFVAGTTCWWSEQNAYDVDVCGHEFRYGPPFAVLFAPFALLPRWLGGSLWGVFNVAVLFWSLRVLMRRLLPVTWSARQVAAFHLLVLLSAARGLWAGQTNTLIIALLIGAAAAIVDRRWWLAAALMALPVYIKVWPLAAVLLLIVCWPKPLAVRFAVALVSCGLLPFAVKHWSWAAASYSDWKTALLGPMQDRHDYRDAWTVWEQMVPVDERAYLVLQLVSALAVLAACLCVRRRAATEQQSLLFLLSLWASWQLLFGPGTERNTISLIAPLTSWSLITAFAERRRLGWMLIAFALVTTFSFGLFERSVQNHFPAIITMLPLGVLAYMTWLIAYGWDCCRQPAAALRLVGVDNDSDVVPPASDKLQATPLRNAA